MPNEFQKCFFSFLYYCFNISKVTFGSACRALVAAELRYLSTRGRFMHLWCVSCGRAAGFCHVRPRARGYLFSLHTILPQPVAELYAIHCLRTAETILSLCDILTMLTNKNNLLHANCSYFDNGVRCVQNLKCPI